MAAVSATTNSREISCNIATLCREIGEHQAALPSLCEHVKDEKKSLDEIGEAKIHAIVNCLGRFASTESDLRKLKSQVGAIICSYSSIPPETSLVWKDQLECIQPQLTECTRQGNYLFEGVLKRVGNLYRQALMQLEEYRQSHRKNEKEKLVGINKTLNQWVTKIPPKPYDFVNPHMAKKSLELLKHSQFLASLLAPKNSLLQLLDDNSVSIGMDALENEWKSLSPEMQQAIDQEICKRKPEETRERLKINRFYHVDEFRLAYIEALRASLLKKHPHLSQEDYCTLVHERALGNEFSNPVGWVHQELPYLESILQEVDKIYQPKAP